MKDRELDDLLHELPRHHARPGFRTRLESRLDEAPPPRDLRWARAAAVGAATLLVALAPIGWQRMERAREDRLARQRVEEMRLEYQALQGELRDMRRQLARSEPVVGLDAGDGLEYLVDLRELARATTKNATPASYRPSQ
jgi:hypothetical protein